MAGTTQIHNLIMCSCWCGNVFSKETYIYFGRSKKITVYTNYHVSQGFPTNCDPGTTILFYEEKV